MLKIFYGNDRVAIAAEVQKLLGEDYEVYDGTENLQPADIINIFQGNSLFAKNRKILLKDLTAPRSSAAEGASPQPSPTSDFYEEIAKYWETSPHDVIIWETTVSQKKSFKDLAQALGKNVQKFEKKSNLNTREVFNVLDTALKDGPRAIKLLEKFQDDEDPYMFFGLLASQAIKKFQYHQGRKELRTLKLLSDLDLQMKTTAVEPWFLIKSFLLELAS